jgi:hypothetical protein
MRLVQKKLSKKLEGSKMTIKKRLFLSVLICVLGLSVSSYSVEVVKNPQPTVTEKELLPLKLHKVISEDLGDDEFLFMAHSIAVSEKFIFIYDSAQARIYKLDKSYNLVSFFGRKGQGPGEFSATGKYAPVFLNIGQDNHLYAHDFKVRKIMGYTFDGKPTRSVSHNLIQVTNPVVDKEGRVFFVMNRDGKIVLEDSKKKILGEFNVSMEYQKYLFAAPSNFLLKPGPFQKSGAECAYTADSKLLILLDSFSTLLVVNENKVSTMLKLWPAEALKEYKRQLKDTFKSNKNSYAPMFSRIIPDQDNKDVFYLQLSSPKYMGKKGDTLFAFNINGELLKTYFIPFNDGRVIFLDKRDNLFYAAHRREEVYIFKEN